MRKLLISLLLAGMILMSGCFDAEFHLTVNRDGSGDFSYQLGFDRDFLAMMESEGEDPLAEMAIEAEADGFTVTRYEDDDYVGIRATQHLPQITAEDLDVFDEASTQGDGLVVEESLFRSHYRFQADMNMEGMGEDEEFGQMMLNQMNFRFTITLPVKPDSHNADSVSEDGKTLTWNLRPGQANPINLEASVPNIVFIAILGAGAALLLIGLIVLIVVLRRRREADYYRPV
ncbi:MAG: DUF3153 domain-containing protein [Firmicutes bacterium]|nr:DUF3153 domain-containing protein [Bacillota bacterium]